MLVLLPPSETKADGGTGAPLDLDQLAFPELNEMRRRLLDDLAALSAGEPATALQALNLTQRQSPELARNAVIHASPTRAAIERYTGVLFDSLDVASLRGAARTRASERLMVGSALFGVVRADDAIPAYRLSAGSRLPGRGTLAALWRPELAPVLERLARDELVVDLRSGAYRQLAPVPGAVIVQVLSQRADGSRLVVSHANKSTKGIVARLLAGTAASPQRAADVARVLRRGRMTVEQMSLTSLSVIVPA